MSDCIFCKIVSEEIPSYRIFENDHALVFLDIAPVNPGHMLIVPKMHYACLEDIPEEELVEVIKAVQKAGFAVKKGLGAEGYSVQLNNDPVAGQIIPHLHFHVIPRNEKDGLRLWPQGAYREGEARETIERLKQAI